MPPSSLSPAARSDALEAMAGEELDLVVVGGGVVGAGAALDAAARGLSVGIVEARDWAAGTSSRSSKLIHGGLRYLEMLDFGLVAEALRERGLLLRHVAPHLVRPVPFLYPLTRRVWERVYVGAGLLLYDTLGAAGRNRGLPRHRHLSRRAARALVPDLREDSLVGAVQYHDAQVDDARLVLALVRTAAQHGAHAANRSRVTGFRTEGGRVTGVQVRDLETGRVLPVRARQVLNATGVWTDETQQLVHTAGPGDAGGRQLSVRASKGVHLVVPRERIRSGTGLILRTETSVLFVIPWQRHWIVGTTDTSWDLDKAHPAASRRDIDYLLEQLNRVLRRPLTRQDVAGVYAGLRPLLSGEREETSRLSREHVVARPAPGLVVVAGGKLTTYRVMAADAVDEVVRALGSRAPSGTERIPLAGARGCAAAWDGRARTAEAYGVPVARVEHLLRRYGDLTEEVLQPCRQRPELAEGLAGAPEYLAAEVVHACTHEGARHLDDVLTRRTRISFETEDRGVGAAGPAARLMAPVLGWSPEQQRKEVEHYLARVEAERASQRQPDDETADSARMGAPEIVPLT